MRHVHGDPLSGFSIPRVRVGCGVGRGISLACPLEVEACKGATASEEAAAWSHPERAASWGACVLHMKKPWGLTWVLVLALALIPPAHCVALLGISLFRSATGQRTGQQYPERALV